MSREMGSGGEILMDNMPRNRRKWDWNGPTSNNRTSEDGVFPIGNLVLLDLGPIKV